MPLPEPNPAPDPRPAPRFPPVPPDAQLFADDDDKRLLMADYGLDEAGARWARASGLA